jgi:hypothetical protein
MKEISVETIVDCVSLSRTLESEQSGESSEKVIGKFDASKEQARS